MGNKASASLPYDIGARVGNAGVPESLWSVHEGKRKRDGEPVTVLRFERKGAERALVERAENLVKRTKTLRHPCCLPYMDGLDAADSPELCIVTESVTTLGQYLGELRGAGDESKLSMAVAWGFSQLLEVVGWINEDCKLCHGALSLDNVFVTRGGDWRLAGFFVCDTMDPLAGGPGRLFREAPEVVPKKYRSPERLSYSWDKLTPVAVDSWALGVLLWECFNGPTGATQDAGSLLPDRLPAYLHKPFQLLTARAPAERPSAKKMLQHPGIKQLCKNELFAVCKFLDEFALKTDLEKVPFIQALVEQIPRFPESMCCYKVLPVLREAALRAAPSPQQPPAAGQPAAGEPATPLAPLALPAILRIGAMIKGKPEEYQRLVVPPLVELFNSNDRAMRVALLQRMPEFIDQVDAKLVNESIFAAVCTGFKDAAPLLRELTVKSAVVLAPKLDKRNLNEVLLRNVIVLLKDVEPAIRTNTLICLTKVIDSMDKETQKRVALNSFPGATRDPFVPARIAALRGMAVSLPYVEDDGPSLAGKVVPSIASALIDPSVEVRQQAFAVMDKAVAKLREMSIAQAERQKREEEEQRKRDQEQRQGGEIRTRGDSAQPAPAADASGSYFSAASAWAVGSITKVVRGTSSSDNTPTPSTTPSPAPEATPGSSSSSSSSNNNAFKMGSGGLKLGGGAAPGAATAAKGGGWGDDDIDVDDLLGETPKAQTRTAAAAAPTSAAKKNDGWGELEEDLAGDGWGEASASKPAPARALAAAAKSTVPALSAPRAAAPAAPQPGGLDDFFGAALSAGPAAPRASPARPPGGLSAKPADESEEAAAERKREEARQRIAARKKPGLAAAPVAKPGVKDKTGDDFFDQW